MPLSKPQVYLVAVLMLASCNEKSSPTQPTTPTTPEPAAPSARTVTLRIVANPQDIPISGATVSIEGESPATTNGEGYVALESTASSGIRRLTITANGFLERQTSVRLGETRTTNIDLISLAPPFSLQFYREFVRDALQSHVTPFPLKRWKRAPAILIKTTDDQGAPLPQGLIDMLAGISQRVVSQFSGGTFEVARIDTAPDVPADAPFTITVKTQSTGCINHASVSWSARSREGPEIQSATVVLCYPAILGSCTRNQWMRPSTVAHELGHAMGFQHVRQEFTGGHIMTQDGGITRGCDTIDASPMELFHARIAYSRPNGNLDPDIDNAEWTTFATPQSTLIQCSNR